MMLKDPSALAHIGFEQGIGFIPFGGSASPTTPTRRAAALWSLP